MQEQEIPDMEPAEPQNKKRGKAAKDAEEIGSSKELYNFLYEACNILRGPVSGATPSTKVPVYWDKGTIPWMSSGEVHKGRVKETDAKISQLGYDGCSTKMVPAHSVVIALAGQGKTRGSVAINDIELCTNQSLCAIVPNEEVNYEYLYHNLKGRYKELRSMSGDVDGRGGLNLKHIQSIKMIIPPMDEQLKFVYLSQQAEKSKAELRKSVDAIDKVIKSLINENL